MTVSTIGPIPTSRVWSGPQILAEDLVGEDLADVLDLHADASAWWVLDRTSDYAQDELRMLLKVLDLDEQVARELLASDRRAKFEEIDQARLVLTNAVSVDTDRGTVTVHPISMLVTDRALICLADVCPALDPARWLTQHAERLATGGSEAGVQVVLSAVIEGYAGVASWMETAIDELADMLFEERPMTKSEQLWAFRLRLALTELRRVTEPMRTVTADIRASRADAERRWRLIEEHHTRVAGSADALREALASLFETSLALADVQLNQIMKKLTAWAAIIAVPTLVTSFVGMNVRFPLAATAAGFWVYSGLMVLAAAVLYLLLRRRDWI